MAAAVKSFVCCVCILVYAAPIQSAKIVFYPEIGRSRYMGMKRIAHELAQRNHEVTLLVSSAEKITESEGITHAIFKVPFDEGFLETLISDVITRGRQDMYGLFGNTSSIPGHLHTHCEALLNDTKLLDSFKDFNLIVSDGQMFCGPLIADYLGIRRIDYLPGTLQNHAMYSPHESFLYVSYIPQPMSLHPMKMNFLQRVKNIFAFWAMKGIGRFMFLPFLQDLKTKYNITPGKTIVESLDDKELTLCTSDFAFEYAQPLRPDYKLIGPVNIQPIQPLPTCLQHDLNSSGDDGAIIVSFGSNVASVLDKEKVDIMAEAFGRLKQKVIWRLQGYIPSSLSPNIRIRAWMPQNDLLGHKKLRAFVSLAGINSVYESLYRGVPVVAMPLFSDQFDNAYHMEDRGVALVVDYKTLTVDDLYNAIQRVINEPRFRENAQRISRLLSDRPRTPVQEAGDWIEYTLRHGSLAHLRPYSSQLTWYQYFLVDVAVFLVLVVLVVIMVIKYTVRLVCWMCCRRTNKQKTQ